MANYLWLPGLAGSYASAPDIADYTLLDFDIRIWCQIDVLAPASTQFLLSHYSTASRGWAIRLDTSGKLGAIVSSDGTSDSIGFATGNSLATTGLSAQTWYCFKITFDADDGAGHCTFNTWYSVDEGLTFLPIVTNSANAPLTLFNSVAPLEIGSRSAGTGNFTGKIKRVQIRNNILDDGTGIVFDEDFAVESEYATSVTDDSANAATVTINGFAQITSLWAAAPTAAQVNSATDATSYATPSWIPKPNRLYLAWIGFGVSSGSIASPSVTGNSITWTKVDGAGAATIDGCDLYAGLSGTSPTAGALTADFGAVTQLYGFIQVNEVDGADLTGTAISSSIQTKHPALGAQASPYTLDFNTTPAVGNRVFFGIMIAVNTAMTPRANWTEFADAGFSAPTRRLETLWRQDASELTAGSSGWAGSPLLRAVSVEIKASFPSTPSYRKTNIPIMRAANF